MTLALHLGLLLLAPPVEIPRANDEFAPIEIVAGDPGRAEPEPEPQPEPAPEPEPEPVPEPELPIDDDLLEEEPTREILVDAGPLGRAKALDVFTHPGGRTVVSKEEMRSLGATSVGEALKRAPGVRSVDGNSGLGSQDTKLNVAVRGVNPRLSSRATVMLDEIPIAPAPYGQPQLSLFPLSLFSISEIDVIRGGATARYGPQTSGGVFNLVSNPIPKRPSISLFTQGDSNLDASLGGAYGATHGRFGMYIEYAPRFGKSYREHSDKQVHGGLAKFQYAFNDRVKLSSLTHGFWEDSELPGGLNRAQFNEDPFQSLRRFDFFRGQRVGSSLKFDWQPNDRQDVDIAGWYAHSYRSTTLASNTALERTLVDEFQIRPRTYDVMGVEPRWAIRWNSVRVPSFSHQLSIGARAAFERAKMYTYIEDVGGRLKTADDDARTAAYAGYVNEKLMFLGGDLVLDVGVRLEYIQIARRSNLENLGVRRNYWAPLPAASLWYAPIDEISLFLAYGRSFGPPQYLQITVAPSEKQLEPETSNSLEFGLKLLELGGLYGESTVWYKDFTNFIDVGEESFDIIPKIFIWGAESELEWLPSEVWDMPGELSFDVGYGWTNSFMRGQAITGNKMPWYPVHEAWGGGSYGFDFGLKFGADVEYTGKQYTDYQNREVEDGDTAAYGPIPAYTLVNVWARMQTPLPRGWTLEFTGGIKNVADVLYISRTDDRNAGILAGRPRTFYLSVGFTHEFARLGKPKHERRSPRRRGAGLAQPLALPI